MSTHLCCARLLAALLCIGRARECAATICAPIPHYFFVGNTATDAKCQYDSIQSAIDAVVCPDSTVVVSDQRSYAEQALMIADKSITLVGVPGPCGNTGGKICDPVLGCGGGPPPAQVKLVGNTGQSVIAISGNSSVTLANLEVTGGNKPGPGGGVYFGANGSLALNNVYVHDNSAQSGGGVLFSGNGTLTLTESTISDNTAIPFETSYGSGGGLFVSSSTDSDHVELTLANGVAITNNSAVNGGGIELERSVVDLAVDLRGDARLEFLARLDPAQRPYLERLLAAAESDTGDGAASVCAAVGRAAHRAGQMKPAINKPALGRNSFPG